MSMGTAVARQAVCRPEATALFGDSGELTWRALDERTNRIANAWREALGLAPGERVAVLAHNRKEVAELLVATHKAAAIFVGLNFRMSESDLEGIFENADPRLIIGEAEYEEQGRRLAKQAGITYLGLDDLRPGGLDALVAGASPQPPSTLYAPRPTDLACIVYTSGSTGRPKGIAFDHGAMLQHATVAALEYGIDPHCRYLIQIPHNSSVNITMAPCLVTGSALGFADNRSFSPDRFADAVARHHVTHTFLVPTQLMRILDDLPVRDPRLKCIETLGYGSSPIAGDRLGQLVDRFGPVFLQLYGMAEIASIGTLLRKEDHIRALTDQPQLLRSAGRPSMGVDVLVVDPEGRPLAPGRRGEVVFSGFHVMREYYGDPDRTASVLIEGWVHSGDVGEFDSAGYLYIVDRMKDLIIRGGQNLAPNDIENVLYGHPEVLEAAVVGAPDPEWGERVVAVVALRRDGNLRPEDLLEFAALSSLPSFCRPEEVRVLESLPKNNVGKIDKRAVRAMFWAGERRV